MIVRGQQPAATYTALTAVEEESGGQRSLSPSLLSAVA